MREKIEQITSRAANNYLALGELGFDDESHYLGPSSYKGDLCLSNPERDALAIYRPPVAASFNKHLNKPLELSRLWRAASRTRELTSFVAASLRWLRDHKRREGKDPDCVMSYANPDGRNGQTGTLHLGGIYDAANFKYVGETDPEPYWIEPSGKIIVTVR